MTTNTTTRAAVTDAQGWSASTRPRSAVSWGAVFAGALIGIATMALLGVLWYAIGTGASNVVSNNMAWWIGGTAIFATFLAGLFAGWFADGRGAGIGVGQGLTEWGLLTFAGIVIGPGVVTVIRSLVSANPFTSTSGVLWTTFWSILVGLGAALLGGVVGGAMAAPNRLAAMDEPAEHSPRGSTPPVADQRYAARPAPEREREYAGRRSDGSPPA